MWLATLGPAACTRLIHGWPIDDVLLCALKAFELTIIMTSDVVWHVSKETTCENSESRLTGLRGCFSLHRRDGPVFRFSDQSCRRIGKLARRHNSGRVDARASKRRTDIVFTSPLGLG